MTIGISKLLIGLKNALLSGKGCFLVPYSKTNIKITKDLLVKGYITSFEVIKMKNILVHVLVKDSTTISSALAVVSASTRVKIFPKRITNTIDDNLIELFFLPSYNFDVKKRSKHGKLAFVLR